MNIDTGREFSEINPQDDPHLYPNLPPGFSYDFDGRIRANPRLPPEFSYDFNNRKSISLEEQMWLCQSCNTHLDKIILPFNCHKCNKVCKYCFENKCKKHN